MTADAFIASLRRIAAECHAEPMSDPARAAAEAKLRVWDAIADRASPAFEHPPDAILDLLARYNLSDVTFWQFAFEPKPRQSFEQMWVVAKQTTREYFVENGNVFEMDMKAAYPTKVGLTSEQFLDIVAMYAEQSMRLPGVLARPAMQPILADFRARAAATHPRALQLGWFEW